MLINMRTIKNFLPSLIVLLIGIISLFVAIDEEQIGGNPYKLSALIMLACYFIYKFFDTKKSKIELEKQVDSFVIFFCFVIIPITLMVSTGIENHIILKIICMLIYTTSSLYKLSLTNINLKKGCNYYGLSIPLSGLILSLVSTFLNFKYSFIITVITCIVLSILILSKIKFKK